MKRIFTFAFALCLLLCGCGKNENPYPTKNPKPAETTAATTEATVPEITLPETEPQETEPAPTEPVAEVIRHPLTGEVLGEEYSGRVVTVVINNLRDALPHYGVSQADLFFEAETEGGITRCLAVFSDVAGLGTVGPVRSCRTFFNNISQAYDAVLFHCGGSVRGRNGYADANGGKISGWEHVDATYVESPYYFRDKDRYNYQGYNWEHTLFTTGEGMAKALEKYDYNTPRALNSGLLFNEEVQLTGEAARKVTVVFRGGKTTEFTYDDASGTYCASQYGSEYVDAGNNQRMAFANVITLYTSQVFYHDGEYSRSYYELVGEGSGHLAIDGQLVAVKWSREAMESPFVFTYEDGTPVTLKTGKTYIAVTSNENIQAEA